LLYWHTKKIGADVQLCAQQEGELAAVARVLQEAAARTRAPSASKRNATAAPATAAAGAQHSCTSALSFFVRVQRVNRAPATATAGVGITIQCHPRTGACTVKSVQARIGESAGGIGVGDTLESVDGVCVQGMQVSSIEHTLTYADVCMRRVRRRCLRARHAGQQHRACADVC